MKILILGVGLSLRRDDGAGIEIVRLWKAQHPETIEKVLVEISELPGLDLLELLDGIDAVIIVDAVKSGGFPGTIIRFGLDELTSFSPDAESAHGWGISETLHLGRAVMPSLASCQVVLIGIVGKDFSLGTGLSPDVQAGLEKAADLIESEIHSFLQ